MKRIGIAGSGKLAEIVVECYNKGLLNDYELVGIYSRNEITGTELAKAAKAKYFSNVSSLLSEKIDYLIEVASREFLWENLAKVLENKTNAILLSIGAFADKKFYEEMYNLAKENEVKIHIANGAVGGFDILRTVALMGETKTTFTTHKGPASLRDTKAIYSEELETVEKEVFRGSGVDAINLFPRKVNVAVATSLASVGPENILVSITSVPNFVGDDHRVEMKNDAAHIVLDMYSKSGIIAGYSVVALLRNLASPIMF